MSPFPNVWAWVANLREDLATAGNAESVEDAGFPGPDTEDEKRIYSLVEEHGRVRQQTVIEETGWNPGKVSRVLQRMEAKGSISRLSVGREKVAALPGYIPEEVE